MALIARKAHAHRVRRLLRQNPAVVLLGAGQVGKTTLAREVARTAETLAGRAAFHEMGVFDLEEVGHSERLCFAADFRARISRKAPERATSGVAT